MTQRKLPIKHHRIILSATQLMDGFHESDGVFDGRLLEDAVAQVEDVAGAVGGLVENLFGAAADGFFVGEEDERVEVALDGAALADGLPGVVEANPPVDADDVPTGFGHGS